MTGGQRTLKPSPASFFFVASKPCLLPDFISGTGERVFAHEKVSGAEGGRAFQQQHSTHRHQRRGEPRPVKLPLFSRSPRGHGESEAPRQFFRRGGEIGVLNPTQVVKLWGKQSGCVGE